MQNIDGRTAVVIGGGGGVGGGIAIALAQAGARVVVGDIQADSADLVAAEIVDAGGSACATRVDSTDDGSIRDICEFATSEYGSLDILSNQCGVIVNEPVSTASDSDWAWIWEFNVMTMIRGVRVALPYIQAGDDGGHIVNTASLAGVLALDPVLTGGVNTGLYTTTKHAVVGYSDMLRAELEPEGIGVTVLCPGLVEGQLGITSARNRPARYGGPMEDPDRGGMPPGAMSREDAGAAVVDSIRANRAYCFTHPEMMPMLTARYEERLADAEGTRAAQEAG